MSPLERCLLHVRRIAAASARIIAFPLATVFLMVAAPAVAVSQDVTLALRGRVVDSAGTPIAKAHIAVVRGTDTLATATTDAVGAFALVVPSDRIVTLRVSAVAYMATEVSLAPRSFARVVLIRRIPLLSEVRVRATVSRPPLIVRVADSTGVAQEALGMLGTSPADAGGLVALASSVPGVSVVGDGGSLASLSILGVSGDGNGVFLNGARFNETSVPRAALLTQTFATSAYDPSLGGFSGGKITLNLAPGRTLASGSLKVTGDHAFARTLASGLARRTQLSTQIGASAGRAGTLIPARVWYNVSAQLDRTEDLRTPLVPLERDAGLVGTADVLTRFAAALDTTYRLGALSTRSSALRSLAASGLGRVDVALNERHEVAIFANASGRERELLPFALATPTQQLRQHVRSLGVQVENAEYVGDRYLSRSRLAAGATSSSWERVVALPQGIVLATPAVPDAPTEALTFGGSGGLPPDDDGFDVQGYQEVTWDWQQHRPKVTLDLRQERYSWLRPDDGGRLLFASMEDFARGVAASFDRRHATPALTASTRTMAASIGDLWHISAALTAQYGVRVERSDVLSTLASLGASGGDDLLRGPWQGSPRLGLSWNYGRGAPRPLRAGTFRGGFGVYQSALTATLLGSNSLNSLSEMTPSVRCIGTAVPIIDWSNSVAAESAECRPAASSDVPLRSGADSTPNALRYSDHFTAPRASRWTLGWTSSLPQQLTVSVDAVFSRNLAQRGVVDLNFQDTAQFLLRDESNRPVFARRVSIDPHTGAALDSVARRSLSAGRLIEISSSRTGTAAQLSVRVGSSAARVASGRYWWTAGYAYTRIDDAFNGFEGPTRGDPILLHRGSASSELRHAISGSATFPIRHLARLTATLQLRSGMAFTPLVAGDVNGDGLANDAAYVFSPDEGADSATASGMRALLARSRPSIRACLAGQLARIAQLNSCRGPWSAQGAATLMLTRPLPGLPARARLLITAANLVSGVNALLERAGGGHIWSPAERVDPLLLSVTGFDATVPRFRYRVNSHFGMSQPIVGNSEQFRLLAQLSLPLSLPRSSQVFESLLRAGKFDCDSCWSAADIRARFLSVNLPNPFHQLLSVGDSLHLTPAQEDSIRAIGTRYGQVEDSVTAVLAATILKHGQLAEAGRLRQGVRQAHDALWDAIVAAVARLSLSLDPDQVRLLPVRLAPILDLRSLRQLRAIDDAT